MIEDGLSINDISTVPSALPAEGSAPPPEVTPLKDIDMTRIEAAAQNAGAIIKRYYEGSWTGDINEAFKTERSVVTAADTESQELLLKELLEVLDCSFLGEEEGVNARLTKEVQMEGYQWVVDPLDGTENMAGYPPVVGVSVGLLLNGEPVLGVIHDPLHNLTFSAKKGEGARVNGKPMTVSNCEEPKKARVCSDFSSKVDTRKESLNFQERLLTDPNLAVRTIKTFGAPVLSMAAVAAGRSELFFRRATKLPDFVAGVAIVREAGGRVVNFQGADWKVTDNGVIAGSPKMIDAFMPCFLPKEPPQSPATAA